MKFIVWLLVGAVCISAEETPNIADSERAARFLNFRNLYQSHLETNEVISEKQDDPNSALEGLYSDCVMSFSLPCLQKKFLVFLDKLGRMEGFSIIGDFLSVKRTTKDTTKPISEKAIEARMNADGDLDSLVEYAIDRFFTTHKLQVKLPFGLSVIGAENTGRSYESGTNAVDIAFPQGYSEGRGKKKKLLMMIVMMAKAKLALLIPLAAILIKIKAVKALFFAKIALLLSMFGILKKAGGLGAIGLGGGAGKLGGFGGGGGGGGYGGGGHGGGSGNKIVIIHDPHHATSGGGGGGGGGGGHSHGHGGGGGGGGGYDSYAPSGGGGGGGGGWSSGGGGDSYSGGHDSGGWGRSWSDTDAQNLAYQQPNITLPSRR